MGRLKHPVPRSKAQTEWEEQAKSVIKAAIKRNGMSQEEFSYECGYRSQGVMSNKINSLSFTLRWMRYLDKLLHFTPEEIQVLMGRCAK